MTNSSTTAISHRDSAVSRQTTAAIAIVPIGRLLFAAIFILSPPALFQANTAALAKSAGVPFSSFLVPTAGVIAFLGGLSVVIGFGTRYGAWLIVLFLVPVTFFMHRFWGLNDAQLAMMQQAHFMKNISMLGAALVFAYFGAGPISIDNWRAAKIRKRRAIMSEESEDGLQL